MTTQALLFLDKARRCLANARAIVGIGLADDAGRNAYYGCFHAAQALIFARTGKIAKTHHGVHSQFFLLAGKEPAIAPELAAVMSRNYDLKAISDYEVDPGLVVSLPRAEAAIDDAQRLLDCIAGLIERREPSLPE